MVKPKVPKHALIKIEVFAKKSEILPPNSSFSLAVELHSFLLLGFIYILEVLNFSVLIFAA